MASGIPIRHGTCSFKRVTVIWPKSFGLKRPRRGRRLDAESAWQEVHQQEAAGSCSPVIFTGYDGENCYTSPYLIAAAR